MEVKRFFKSQVELADSINKIVDSYWNNQISEDILIENIVKIVSNNITKVIVNEKFTAVLRQKCGKRRLEVVSKILADQLKSLETNYMNVK